MAWRHLVRRTFAVRLGFAALAIFLLACAALVADGLLDNRQVADVGVVLGSKVDLDGVPSLALQARLNEAINLYRRGYFKYVLVSGGLGREGYDEPVVMRRYLEDRGVPAAAIFEDDGGLTSWDTAQDTAAFLRAHHLHSTLIISQYFHLLRCRLAFAKFGIAPVYWSHARFWNIRDFFSVPREIFGLIDYSMRRAQTAS